MVAVLGQFVAGENRYPGEHPAFAVQLFGGQQVLNDFIHKITYVFEFQLP